MRAKAFELSDRWKLWVSQLDCAQRKLAWIPENQRAGSNQTWNLNQNDRWTSSLEPSWHVRPEFTLQIFPLWYAERRNNENPGSTRLIDTAGWKQWEGFGGCKLPRHHFQSRDSSVWADRSEMKWKPKFINFKTFAASFFREVNFVCFFPRFTLSLSPTPLLERLFARVSRSNYFSILTSSADFIAMESNFRPESRIFNKLEFGAESFSLSRPQRARCDA